MGIAILDHDKATVAILAEIIDEMGETPCPFTDKDKFLGAISPTAHRAAVIDEEFVDVIEGTKQVYQSIEILAMGTSGQDRCIQAGATGYLKKPFPAGDFRQALQALLLGPGSRSQSVNGSFIATDRSMQKIIEVLRKVAPTQAPVLIQGESGTGKEVIARYIHQHSKRAGGPYVGINLAAIPDTLLESELSVMKRAPSPARTPPGSASSSLPTRGPSCWMRSRRSASACRPSCLGSSRKSRSTG